MAEDVLSPWLWLAVQNGAIRRHTSTAMSWDTNSNKGKNDK
jgi:hypothetical protein